MAIDTGALYYLVDPFVQWENVNGKPIVGGHVEVFEAGTDNKIITYADWDGTRHPFKIPLGSDGRAVILVDPGYRYDAYVYDSFNNLVCSRLNIIPLSDGDITIDGMGQVYHDETLSGKGTPNSPLTVISGGKVYGGIYPIDVNNELDMISADNVPLGVQDPLYFVQDDEEGCIIGFSGETLPEGTMNESAFGYEDGKITGYNGSGFSAGLNYEAGSYVDIDGNTINVTGLQPAGNYQSAGDYVVHDELSSYATQDWVENQSYMKEYMESAFYPSTSNPSGYLTAHQDISNKLDTTAFSTVSGDFLTAIPDDYATKNYVSDSITGKLDSTAFSTVSGNFLTAVPEGYATENWVTSQGYLTAHQSLDGLMSADLLEISDNKITGYNGTAFAGQGGVTGDFELSAGSGISIVDYPLEQKTVISVTAQGGNPEVEQAVIDNSATWDTVTAKQNELTFGYHDTAISSINEATLYDNSAHARINTLAGRISDLSSNKLDTTAFSDVSGTFLTAHQDLSDYQTTAGMTAYQEAGDYYSASNPSGFITGVDLTPYQLTADMTAYQPAGDYLTTADSADFYTTANESGFISEVPAGTMNESAFSYDASDNITAYNGSAFKAGDEFPQSATEAIETVTANSADWNGTTDTVSSNSGVWGGSALPISAGPGIKFEMVDNTLVASTDETLLYSTSSPANTINLSEASTGFEKLRLELSSYQSREIVNYTEVKPNASYLTYFANALIPAATYPLQVAGIQFTSNNAQTYTMTTGVRMCYKVNETYGDQYTAIATTNIRDVGFITKIWGINRI